MSINYISLSAEHMAILSTKWGLLTSKKRNEAIEPGVIMMFVYFVNIGGLFVFQSCEKIEKSTRLMFIGWTRFTASENYRDSFHAVYWTGLNLTLKK